MQAQLNKWVDEWDVPIFTGCNLASTVIETAESETHDFMIRHGGCRLNGVKAKFVIPSNVDLSQVVVSATDKTHLYDDTDDCSKGNGCYQTDVFVGKKDRIGLAIPKGSGWTMLYSNAWISDLQA